MNRRENASTGMSTKLVDKKKLVSGTMVEQASNKFGDNRAWNSSVLQGNFYNTVFSQSSQLWYTLNLTEIHITRLPSNDIV